MDTEQTYHPYSVLKNEVLEALRIDPNGIYVDCTAGGGGHSLAIAERLTGGRLIAIDQDAAAIEAVGKRLSGYEERFETVHDNFRNVKTILGDRKADGAIIDLGVSSYQLDTPERGFSSLHDAPLDMRMNPESEVSAYDVINGWSEKELAQIFFNYGEEKFANRIWCLQDGKIEDFRGSFSEYREYKRRQEEIAQATKAKPEKKGDTRQKRPPNREKALKKAEAAVEKAEAAMAELDAQIQQYSADYEKLMELTEKKEQAEQELEALYAAWEALENE